MSYHICRFPTYTRAITRKWQILSHRKLKYEKSLHAHRFAKRHVRKHPSVFLNVIDGENISRALTGLYLCPSVFKDPISYPIFSKESTESLDERGKKRRDDDVCVYSRKRIRLISQTPWVLRMAPLVSRIIRI